MSRRVTGRITAAHIAAPRRSQAKPDHLEGGFAQAVARKLVSLRIATVPGLSSTELEPDWYDIAIEMHRRNAEFESERETERQTAEAAKAAPKTAAGRVSAALREQQAKPSGGTMPLNGAAVVRAALAGGHGTINGT